MTLRQWCNAARERTHRRFSRPVPQPPADTYSIRGLSRRQSSRTLAAPSSRLSQRVRHEFAITWTRAGCVVVLAGVAFVAVSARADPPNTEWRTRLCW
jgi:hypothetical protein